MLIGGSTYPLTLHIVIHPTTCAAFAFNTTYRTVYSTPARATLPPCLIVLTCTSHYCQYYPTHTYRFNIIMGGGWFAFGSHAVFQHTWFLLLLFYLPSGLFLLTLPSRSAFYFAATYHLPPQRFALLHLAACAVCTVAGLASPCWRRARRR